MEFRLQFRILSILYLMYRSVGYLSFFTHFFVCYIVVTLCSPPPPPLLQAFKNIKTKLFKTSSFPFSDIRKYNSDTKFHNIPGVHYKQCRQSRCAPQYNVVAYMALLTISFQLHEVSSLSCLTLYWIPFCFYARLHLY